MPHIGYPATDLGQIAWHRARAVHRGRGAQEDQVTADGAEYSPGPRSARVVLAVGRAPGSRCPARCGRPARLRSGNRREGARSARRCPGRRQRPADPGPGSPSTDPDRPECSERRRRTTARPSPFGGHRGQGDQGAVDGRDRAARPDQGQAFGQGDNYVGRRPTAAAVGAALALRSGRTTLLDCGVPPFQRPDTDLASWASPVSGTPCWMWRRTSSTGPPSAGPTGDTRPRSCRGRDRLRMARPTAAGGAGLSGLPLHAR